jgi:hypothetical protein
VIARNMQRAGASLRSLAEPVVDTTSDFADLVLAMPGATVKLERRRVMSQGRCVWRETHTHPAPAAGSSPADGETQRSIARSYNVSQATTSRLRNGVFPRWRGELYNMLTAVAAKKMTDYSTDNGASPGDYNVAKPIELRAVSVHDAVACCNGHYGERRPKNEHDRRDERDRYHGVIAVPPLLRKSSCNFVAHGEPCSGKWSGTSSAIFPILIQSSKAPTRH